MIASDLLTLTEAGLYCPAGDFHVDPWRPVPRAVITHAHSDHARQGSERYLTSHDGRHVLATRMVPDAVIDTLEYGESIDLNGVRVSLHPAGHILGSSQVRIEHRGRVCVASGDYKVDRDATCAPFELLRCHSFITESTFGLPVYRWPPQQEVMAAVNEWWLGNREAGRASVIFAYSLGKAQRLIAGLDPQIGPIYCHGAVERVNRDYRETGVSLPATAYASSRSARDYAGAMVVAPPSANGSPWLRRFGNCSTAFASGWMAIRGTRRRRAVDRGFVLSDHVDWPGLTGTVRESGAEQVFVTHGFTAACARWFGDQGLDAHVLPTRFEGEQDDRAEDAEQEPDAQEPDS
ncbi:hypothetical protein Mal4_21090 [Maioricimonas rarisocia]|uniref:Uncharacterized protein n=1 Tax=Maioricimonas rarisocia TaxID=2528026 RepID=A0A517Z5M2_9PLAN|nr:ligase-associated DNA damage response exonuclease [Maioricimonas rarisocia]QDU37792.1 hypothetical protein Mal4_21090 [Maioricimonas rarisocia]